MSALQMFTALCCVVAVLGMGVIIGLRRRIAADRQASAIIEDARGRMRQLDHHRDQPDWARAAYPMLAQCRDNRELRHCLQAHKHLVLADAEFRTGDLSEVQLRTFAAKFFAAKEAQRYWEIRSAPDRTDAARAIQETAAVTDVLDEVYRTVSPSAREQSR